MSCAYEKGWAVTASSQDLEHSMAKGSPRIMARNSGCTAARACVVLAGCATQSAQNPLVVAPLLSNAPSRCKSLTLPPFQVGRSVTRLKIEAGEVLGIWRSDACYQTHRCSLLQPDCPVMSNLALAQFRTPSVQPAPR